MIIRVDLPGNGYDILIERGCLKNARKHLNLDRKVMIVTDDGVPEKYPLSLAGFCKEAYTETVKTGEESKSIAVFERITAKMLEYGFSRGDCVAAVGGGVVGDLAGFCASCFMRGIDFYNIPTTSLAQIDSSVGGKTAVNLCGIKNVVGSFYQPKKVLMDFEVLETLPRRQMSNGLCEAVKMAATCDADLFELMENGDIYENTDEIIARCVTIKKGIVEKDEKESGLRRVLNFGHTVGHAIESGAGNPGLYHGECVAIGMLPMCSEKAEKRLKKVLLKLNLPTEYDFTDTEKIISAIRHDKKGNKDGVNIVTVDEIGSFSLCEMTYDEIKERLVSYSKKERNV